MKCLPVLLAALVFLPASPADSRAQIGHDRGKEKERHPIGNLDWIHPEKKPSKARSRISLPLTVMLDPGIGGFRRHDVDYDTRGKKTYEHSSTDMELHMDAVARLPVLTAEGLSHGGPPAVHWDVSTLATFGLGLANFDFTHFEVLLSAAPEIGVSLPAGTSHTVRPFLSFGPGLSLSDPSSPNLDVVTLLRLGADLRPLASRYVASAGLARIYRSSDSYYLYESTIRSTMLFLGFGMKLIP